MRSRSHKHRKRLSQVFGRRLLVALMILLQLSLLSVMLYRFHQFYLLASLLTLLSVATAFHLMMRHDKMPFKLSLIFLILLFPVFGGFFYWVFHFQTSSVGFRRRLERLEKKAQADYVPSPHALENAKRELPRDKKLMHYLQQSAAFPIYGDTQTRYFPSGKEMLEALLIDLEGAEHFIFLEYFILDEGVMWDSILDVLKRKAAAGVDVRVIYDDIGCIRTLPAGYAKKLEKMGIRCRVFNRFRPLLTSVQNNRDHRKIAVVDGKIAYTGGVNLADEYIGARIRFGHWKDAAIRLCGDAVDSFTIMFLQIWSLLDRSEEHPKAYLPARQAELPADGWVQPYTDSPMDRENVAEHVYLHAITRTQRYLYITTPYLMVGDDLMTALKNCAAGGVDVRIITPGIPDKPLVHFTTRSYYRELIAAGVKVYELSDGFMHAKTVVSDGDLGIVGTVNMDFRSLYLHFECGTCLYASSAVAELEADFLTTLTRCRQISEKDCKANFIVKFLQEVCRVFAPLM